MHAARARGNQIHRTTTLLVRLPLLPIPEDGRAAQSTHSTHSTQSSRCDRSVQSTSRRLSCTVCSYPLPGSRAVLLSGCSCPPSTDDNPRPGIPVLPRPTSPTVCISWNPASGPTPFHSLLPLASLSLPVPHSNYPPATSRASSTRLSSLIESRRRVRVTL